MSQTEAHLREAKQTRISLVNKRILIDIKLVDLFKLACVLRFPFLLVKPGPRFSLFWALTVIIMTDDVSGQP